MSTKKEPSKSTKDKNNEYDCKLISVNYEEIYSLFHRECDDYIKRVRYLLGDDFFNKSHQFIKTKF